jgi:hypothetical protein
LVRAVKIKLTKKQGGGIGYGGLKWGWIGEEEIGEVGFEGQVFVLA